MKSALEGNLNLYDDHGDLIAIVHNPKHPTYYSVKKMNFDDIIQLQGGVQLPAYEAQKVIIQNFADSATPTEVMADF